MDRRLRQLAHVAIWLTVASAGATLVLHSLNRPLAVGEDTQDWLRLAVSPLVTVPLAGFLTVRRVRHPIGWLLLSAALCQALSGFGDEYGAAATVRSWPLAGLALMVGS
ncbi:MAG: hypothetical protein QOK15_2842, partial [Nocardioidaceae bacterium]|nr:hypothetical protein [Nocardioidaceae bacterium]